LPRAFFMNGPGILENALSELQALPHFRMLLQVLWWLCQFCFRLGGVFWCWLVL